MVNQYFAKEGLISYLLSRAFGIFVLAFGLMLISNITSIYNKMTIICAPIFILVTYSVCTHPAQEQMTRNNIYRAFPWIGMYLHTLNNTGRKRTRYMILAFLFMIVIFYCLYLAAIQFWNMILFQKPIPAGLNENFYGFIAVMEFLTLLFVRTRSTLKYLPKVSVILMLMFLYYVKYTIYGFYNMALFILGFAISGVFAYFLNNFEIPGTNWNPSYHYTPSADRPRTLYFPVFSMGWYHDLPQLWTMFYPLFGRTYFNNTEMALVNRNYNVLINSLQNNPNDPNQNAGQPGNGIFNLNPGGNINNQGDAELPNMVDLDQVPNPLDNAAGRNISSNLNNEINPSDQNLLADYRENNPSNNRSNSGDVMLEMSSEINSSNQRNNPRRNTGRAGNTDEYQRIDDEV